MIKPKLQLSVATIVLAGCSPQGEQSQTDQPFGPEWKAKQASYEAACVAKGRTAVVCEQTNPADEYTDEFRQSVLKHSVAIELCLKGEVGPCGKIENEPIGPCMSYASEVTKPSDHDYRAEQNEVCAVTLQIIREAGRP